MMINCPRHGYQLGLLLSRDLASLIDEHSRAASYRIVSFTYRGEVESKMYLSREFAEGHGLSSESTMPLPDEYPEWYLTLVGVCEKCAAESFEGAQLIQT